MSKKVTLSEEKILDSWSVLIEDAQGRADEFYGLVMKFVEENKMPDVRAEMVVAYPHGEAKFFSAFFESARKLGRNYLMIALWLNFIFSFLRF